MKRRLTARAALQTGLVILGVIVAAILVGNVISFLSTRNRLPQTTMLGDIDISGLTVDEAVTRTIRSLQTPVALRYQTSIIQLSPDDVDFQINEVVLRIQLDKALSTQQGLDKLPGYLLRRSSDSHINMPYQYSEDKLDAFIGTVASQYDQSPKPAQADQATLLLAPGQDGQLLNKNDSRQLILNALASASSRFVDLPVDVVPNGAATLKSLGALIQGRIQRFSAATIAGVFVKDLKTGQEFSLNGDVAFSAQGWLKMAIVIEAMRTMSQTISPQISQQLASVVTDGGNSNANEVLKMIGHGDAMAGVSQLNSTLKRMGLVSTFLAQPYDQPAKPDQIITPGNVRTDVNAAPDANAQSTPAEVGLLYEMLEQCRNNTGALPLAFASEFTPAKCEQILNILGQNNASILIAAGSQGATVIHRQSWDANNHGDAALIHSPVSTYVLVIMLHGNADLNWADTSRVISDIARAAYGFFNKAALPPPAAAMNAAPPP